MQKMIDILGASTALSVETGLAILASVAITIILMIIFRRVTPVQRVVLPGLKLTRAARDRATTLLENEKELDTSELWFVAFVVIAQAVRGAATLILAGMIFTTMMAAVAPLMAL